MKIGYTEFSFGYAFTENLIRSSATAPTGAPIFPNLVQEGSAGYDVRIDLPGVPFFFQYKLPEIMKKSTAGEIANSGAPLTLPFFRMPLMRRDLSDQHQILIDLEKTFPDAVYYASPEIRSQRGFNIAYNAANVHRRSVLFSPTEIGPLPDNKNHTVAYEAGAVVAYYCSEAKELHAKRYEKIIQAALSLFEIDRFKTLEVASHELRDSVRSRVRPSMREVEGQAEQRIRSRRATSPDRNPKREQAIVDILVAREMARVDLAAELEHFHDLWR